MRPPSPRPAGSRDVERLFRETLARYGMIRPGESVLAGVSGGGDSVLLLHLLVRHRARAPFRLTVAHLNHGLRGAESDADEAFVRELAGRFALPFKSGRADLERGPGDSSSVEERARRARRAFLLESAREAGCGRIALGHTLDDQVETVLMWLLRGTGRGGLAGMSPVTPEGIIRPLIGVRRREVRECLASLGESHREDPSNEDPSRTRNRIRRHLVPLIEAEFPGSVETVAGATETLAAEDLYLREEASRLQEGDAGRLDAERLGAAHPALARRAIRLAAEKAGIDAGVLARGHVERILLLAGSGMEGRRVDLPGGGRVERRSRAVVFRRGERSGGRKR